MKAVCILLAVIIFLLLGLVAMKDIKRDSTDSPTKRSELILKVDYETGCEYLSEPRGGITPRLDSTGKHICRAH